jgi:hypothetical protein
MMLEPASAGASLPADTQVNVSITPKESNRWSKRGCGAAGQGQITNQFVVLLMDHEGPFGVRINVEGSLGRAKLETDVNATYDTRPPPVVLYLSILPFLLIGGLWLKVLVRRREPQAPR